MLGWRCFSGYFLSLFSSKKEYFKSINGITGFYPKTIACYIQALRHHSVSSTIHKNGSKDSNERLEYLGDTVLNTIIAELLFNKFPYKNEGFLTEMRSKIVSRESLNDLAIKIGLSTIVQYDRRAINVHSKNSIFGNALEAFIGAIFLDGGFELSKEFIHKKLLTHIDLDALQHVEKNFKGRLIEWGQKNGHTIEFDTIEEMDKKQRIFEVYVKVDGVVNSNFKHISKKKAEQLAAEKVCESIGILE
ncbi:MAG: ribonuclease III [Bacteroidia bacterium]|nr:ribonuclease III [Bacteroidia bacterium]MCC7532461.1 ribonuclease III [Bacteroidia bacterium]